MEQLFIVLLSIFIYANSRHFPSRRRDFWPLLLALFVVPSHGWYLYRLLTIKVTAVNDFFSSMIPFFCCLWPLQLAGCGILLWHLWHAYPGGHRWRYGATCLAYGLFIYWILKPIVIGYYRWLTWSDGPSEGVSMLTAFWCC